MFRYRFRLRGGSPTCAASRRFRRLHCTPQRCRSRPKFDFFRLMPMIPANWATLLNDFSMVSRNACSLSGTVSPKRAANTPLRSACRRCSGSTSEIRAQKLVREPARYASGLQPWPPCVRFRQAVCACCSQSGWGNPRYCGIPIPRSSKVGRAPGRRRRPQLLDFAPWSAWFLALVGEMTAQQSTRLWNIEQMNTCSTSRPDDCSPMSLARIAARFARRKSSLSWLALFLFCRCSKHHRNRDIAHRVESRAPTPHAKSC